MEDMTTILEDGDALNDSQLLLYLQGKACGDEAHAVERQMAESEFVNDAVEGLQKFSSPKKLDDYVGQLNKKLQQQLGVKKQQQQKRAIKHLGWVIFAVVLILVLCVLGYVVIHGLNP